MNRLLMLIVLACALVPAAHCAEANAAAQPRTIVLVRHGHYTPDPAFDETVGPHLSPIGIAQAYLVAARLAALPERFDAMLVSPMNRARDTAAAIATGFPGRHFETLDDLAECTPPTRRTEITRREKPADMKACAARLDHLFATRFVPAAGAAQTDLIVCHGNVIRFLVTRALGVDTRAWLEMSVGNASITRIRVEADGRFKVLAVGDVGHIPPNLRTGASGDAHRDLSVPPLP